MKKIFISYSRSDKIIVESIRAEIESRTKQECWMDVGSISYESQDFAANIVQAINDCTVFLFMISDDSQQSRYACGELKFATEKNKSIFLININQCELSDKFLLLYSQCQLCDYTKEEERIKLIDYIFNVLQIERPLDAVGKSRLPMKLSKTTLMTYKDVLIVGLIALLIILALLFSGMLSFEKDNVPKSVSVRAE